MFFLQNSHKECKVKCINQWKIYRSVACVYDTRHSEKVFSFLQCVTGFLIVFLNICWKFALMFVFFSNEKNRIFRSLLKCMIFIIQSKLILYFRLGIIFYFFGTALICETLSYVFTNSNFKFREVFNVQMPLCFKNCIHIRKVD